MNGGMNSVRWVAVVAAASLAGLCATAVLAQKGGSAKKPAITAEMVMDRGAAALGPKAAWDKIRSSVMTGTISAPSQKISGTVELRAKRPNRVLVKQTIQGVGVILQGYDGTTGWAKDPVQGVRKLDGAELAAIRRAALFDAHIQWRKLYKKWELIGTRKVNGRDAYVVRLSPAIGRVTLEYHDTKTFRLVRTDMVTETPQGPVPMELYPSDYRTTNGVVVPFTLRQRQLRPGGAVDVFIRIKSVRVNVPIPDSVFAMPKS